MHKLLLKSSEELNAQVPLSLHLLNQPIVSPLQQQKT